MAKRVEAARLPEIRRATPKTPVIGVFATSDPRIDKASRARCQNIAKMAANVISGSVVLPDKTPVPVVYSTVLVDGEAQEMSWTGEADIDHSRTLLDPLSGSWGQALALELVCKPL